MSSARGSNQINPASRVYVAGHRGLVGSAICRRLEPNAYPNLITRTRAELDLLNQSAVDRCFAAERPEYVFLAAARVGGIFANSTHPAEFLRETLLIQTNVIDSAYRHGAKKTSVSRLVMHLSESRAAADPRGITPYQHARTDQRSLRDR